MQSRVWSEILRGKRLTVVHIGKMRLQAEEGAIDVGDQTSLVRPVKSRRTILHSAIVTRC